MITMTGIYVEDEKAQYDRYEAILRSLLRQRNVQLEMQHVHSERGLTNTLDKLRPHVVFVDNYLGDAGAHAGLSIIAKHKGDYPDTVFCLLSREEITIEQFGLKTPNPDAIISKIYLGGKKNQYKEFVADWLVQQMRRAQIGKIHYAQPFDTLFKAAVVEDVRITELEFQSILEQVTYSGDFSSDANFYDEIEVSELPGGRSGATVVRLRLKRRGSDKVVGVLKVSPLEYSHIELVNYNRFVKWTLPYTWRVDVLGSARTGRFGALCYSFVFEGQGDAKSAAACMLEGDPTIVPLICDTIFNPDKKNWYAEITTSKEDASEYFASDPFFKNPKQMDHREQRFAELLVQHFPGEDLKSDRVALDVSGIRVPKPNRLLFTNNWGKVKECICHGDLNPDNIMYHAASKTVAFIDFQRTGRNHVFRDFVSLESGLRMNWPSGHPNLKFGEYIAQEKTLQSETGWREDQDYIAQCKLIRERAIANFGADGGHLYLIAAAVHFLWLCVRFDDLSASAYQRLLAGTAAALIELDAKR